MQNYNWDLKAQFVFPEEYGLVEDVVSVDIKPRWQLIETEDSLRLVGIYHITSTVRFDPHELPEYSEGTLIEHLELNGNDGYFEYALPLEVNLPKERIPIGCSPEITIEEIQYDVYDGSNASFNWYVYCSISEPVIETINEEDSIAKFESYLESSSTPLEIPSASAFAEMIQKDDFENVVSNEENVEALSLENDIEEDNVAITDDTSYDESFSSYYEPEAILHSANIYQPEQNRVELEAENNHIEEEMLDVENVLDQKERNNSEAIDDDFFSDLSESYTLLEIKSNKINPVETSNTEE